MPWKFHTAYVVLFAILALGSYIAVHSWLSEHDARLAAEQQEKVSEAAIKGLQSQIQDRDAQATKQVEVVVKTIHDVATPAQAISAIPTLSDVPLNARPAIDNTTQVSVDAIPLAQELATAKVCAIQLPVCQQDLKDTKSIVSQKDDEINTLKKPQGFWSRVKSTAKVLGIGIGLGIIATHSL